MTEIVLNVVFPAAVLMFGASTLGPRWALGIALLGPLVAVVLDRWRTGRTTALSVIALVSILLSGAINLVQVDARWFAAKEAALPLAYAVLVMASAWTPWPAMSAVLETVLDPARVGPALEGRGEKAGWQARIRRDTLWFAGTLAGSAVASGALAAALVHSPPETAAYAEEVGRYTAWGLPAVTVPSVLAAAWLFRSSVLDLERRTGLDVDAMRR